MKLLNISKSFKNKIIYQNLNLDINEGKVTVILGESGCGKTTLLSIISGILKDYSGKVIYENDTSLGIGYIFQENALIPWKTVYENLKYTLKDKIDEERLDSHIKKYLKIVKLSENIDSYPVSLSGGMKRRVGIARGFAFPSQYLIMDEPFEFLDMKTKGEIIEDFKKLQKLEQKTVIFVTHDIESALEIGDTIVILGEKPTQIVKRFDNINDKRKIETQIKNLFL